MKKFLLLFLAVSLLLGVGWSHRKQGADARTAFEFWKEEQPSNERSQLKERESAADRLRRSLEGLDEKLEELEEIEKKRILPPKKRDPDLRYYEA